MRVLVVEDQDKMRDVLRRGLVDAGYAVDEAADGREGLRSGLCEPYDVIILDVMLPWIDGFDVCRRLRAADIWTPVLMLTARDEVSDRLAGLDHGADDYMLKPFASSELLSRLRALLRRGAPERPAVLRCGPLSLDPGTRIVACDGESVHLSPKEFGLLELLLRSRGQVLSRTTIIEHVWDSNYDGESNLVDVYVKYLRDKIDRRFDLRLLHTVRGMGYRLDCPEVQ